MQDAHNDRYELFLVNCLFSEQYYFAIFIVKRKIIALKIVTLINIAFARA
jgi:hypothetical protein